MTSVNRSQPSGSTETRIAIDIGSTMVKVARLGRRGELLEQAFYPRDFDAGIAPQVNALLRQWQGDGGQEEVLVCSSANGGLRVGILCLTPQFSGAVFRNQVLAAGANPVFVHALDDSGGDLRPVDILLVGGGIDCEEAEPLALRLDRLTLGGYRYGTLMYAGNKHLASRLTASYPQAVIIDNPLADDLWGRPGSVFQALRRAYLDDLVYKEGISELKSSVRGAIHPTPEVVSRGFQRAVFHRSDIEVGGACVLIDIGGATTDLHYTVEIIRDDSPERPAAGSSIARYVFTDLGVFASYDSTVLQLRSHPRLYEFLTQALDGEVREVYGLLREGEYTPSSDLLAYACLFLGLDRFAQGRGPGLPVAELGKVAQILLTGGAAQALDEAVVARLVKLFVPAGSAPMILIDRRYKIWTDGITWPAILPA